MFYKSSYSALVVKFLEPYMFRSSFLAKVHAVGLQLYYTQLNHKYFPTIFTINEEQLYFLLYLL